jgi:hypothetical protein
LTSIIIREWSIKILTRSDAAGAQVKYEPVFVAYGLSPVVPNVRLIVAEIFDV